MNKNLCDAPDDAASIYACKRIRCTTRREISPSDANDLPFDSLSSGSYSTTSPATYDFMFIPAGGAKLYVNQQSVDDAYKVYMTNNDHVYIDVTLGAMAQYFFSATAIVGALMLQSMF